MAYAISISKIVPGVQENADIIFGQPLLMKIFMGMFHPGADPTSLLLHPIGQAAWVGLFATALNLLPCWQLDGGHILYTLASKKAQRNFTDGRARANRDGNSLVARVGSVGNRSARALAAIQAPAGI